MRQKDKRRIDSSPAMSRDNCSKEQYAALLLQLQRLLICSTIRCGAMCFLRPLHSTNNETNQSYTVAADGERETERELGWNLVLLGLIDLFASASVSGGPALPRFSRRRLHQRSVSTSHSREIVRVSSDNLARIFPPTSLSTI